MSAPAGAPRRTRTVRASSAGPPADDAPGPVRSWLLHHPLSSYHLLLGATLLLLLIGLVMVLSASSVESYETLGSSFALAQRQTMFAIIGVAAMVGVSRMRVKTIRRLAWPALVVTFAMLVVVLVVGVSVAGQRNWIQIVGPFRFQPSELAKLALVLWGADLLARKEPLLDQWRHLLVPLLPVAFLMMGLVLLEKDLGNVMILLPILAGLLFAAGAPWRLFGALGVVAVGGVAVMSMVASYRVKRFTAWLDPSADPLGVGYQLTHAQFAFAVGGWWGQGLGASKEKWGSLPEAHTDFIFAVVGEELGLAGTLVILLLFAVLVFATLRVARDTQDSFVRMACTGVAAWLGVQTVLNLGAVLGLTPITGVPLPLVSYGGSSLIPTLVALGMVMAFARQEPRRSAAASATQQRAGSARGQAGAPARGSVGR